MLKGFDMPLSEILERCPRVWTQYQGGSPRARLASAKARAAWGVRPSGDWREEMRRALSYRRSPVQWQYTTEPETKYQKAERRWVFEHFDAACDHLRHVQMADEVVSLGHRGWYATDLADETYRGVVAMRPGRGWMAGYEDGVCCPSPIIFNLEDIHETAEEAAHAADELARIDAEKNREWCERERARERLAELRSEVATLAADHDALRRCHDDPAHRRACERINARRVELAQELRDLEWAKGVNA